MSDRFSSNVNFTLAAVFFLATFFSYTFPDYLVAAARQQVSDLPYVENSNIPEFYRTLSEEKGNFSIIEYPAFVRDRNNHFLYYESFHKKEVLKGYFFSHDLKKRWSIMDIGGTGMWPLEFIFSHLEKKRMYFTFIMDFFTNIIDLYDINSIKKSKAKYVILHKDLKNEIIAVKDSPQFKEDRMNGAGNISMWDHFNRATLHFKGYYQRYFREPVYEDNILVVFQVN